MASGANPNDLRVARDLHSYVWSPCYGPEPRTDGESTTCVRNLFRKNGLCQYQPMSSTSRILFSFLLLTLASCESHKVEIMPSAGPVSEVKGGESSVLSSLDMGHKALERGDFDDCAHHFAAAARISTGDQAANCWYRASQCAARASDFTKSSFYIESAVSSGYANSSQLRSDTLLEPLQSAPRWHLIEDGVYENERERERSAPRQEISLCQIDESPETSGLH